MPFSDLPPTALRAYSPELVDPRDFDEFWAVTLAESRAVSGEIRLQQIEGEITQLVVEDLTFPGFAGESIRAWVTRPLGGVEPLPTVIEYVGYGGGRGLPFERIQWAAAGFVHILMDTRGQGSNWGTGGDPPDPHGSGPATHGVMTRGIESPGTYYYRRLFTDAVRLVDAARTLDFVDADRVAVAGASQGGAITLAVAGLVPDLIAVMPDVPFLCDFHRSATLTPSAPFTELRTYLSVHRDRVAQTFTTLSYFDGVAFAKRASAPGLFSVAFMDDIVLPSTVYAAFNHYASAKQIVEYEFNGHEAGQAHQWRRQVAWLRQILGE